MQFYRRSTNVSAEMEEMSAEGSKTSPLSAAREGAAADGDADERKAVQAAEDDSSTRTYSLMQLFKDHELRQPLLIACALVTIQQFSGINAVRLPAFTLLLCIVVIVVIVIIIMCRYLLKTGHRVVN